MKAKHSAAGASSNNPGFTRWAGTTLDFALPDKQALAPVLDGIIASAELTAIKDDLREAVLDEEKNASCAARQNNSGSP